MRDFIATLAFSQGIPMLSHGDEIARTQNGNNNAYAQDNEINWPTGAGRRRRGGIQSPMWWGLSIRRALLPFWTAAISSMAMFIPAPGIADIVWLHHGDKSAKRGTCRTHGCACCATAREQLMLLFPTALHAFSLRPAEGVFRLPTQNVPTRLLLDSADPGKPETDVVGEEITVAAHSAVLTEAFSRLRHELVRQGSAVRRKPERRWHAFPALGARSGRVSVQIEGHDAMPMRSLADGWFEVVVARGPGTQYRYLLDRGSRCRIRRRARRPTTCTIRASWSIRAATRGATRIGGGRPWRETVLYELHVGVFGGFAGVRASCPAGRAGHHGGRTDAGQRFSRADATGAMTACCPTRRTRLRHARRSQGAGRRRARPRADDLPRRRLQSLRPGRELPAALRAADSSARMSHAVGSRQSISAAARCAASSPRTCSTG